MLDVVYFVYISDNWVYLQIPNLVLTFVGMVFIFFMPESPRFLVATKQYDKARVVFAQMARWNGLKSLSVERFVF